MQPLAVHHVSVNVDDIETALDFYVNVLGLTARTDRPDFGFGGAWLDAGGQQVHLIEGKVPEGGGEHFALLVADINAAISDLRAQDIKVSDASPVGKNQQAFLTDPAGNLIEIHQAG